MEHEFGWVVRELKQIKSTRQELGSNTAKLNCACVYIYICVCECAGKFIYTVEIPRGSPMQVGRFFFFLSV